MASPWRIHVAPDQTGLLAFRQDDQTATKVTALLQKDLEKHHVFINASGFHNHIPHHLLTLYGTGCGPSVLQAAYDNNSSYQLKAMRPDRKVIDALREDWATNAKRYLGIGRHYSEFLGFFQQEIEEKGWQQVVVEYLFSENLKSKDLFGRLFAGLLHPLIQLLYGLEWEQPTIIAQGLAQAAVHKDIITGFLAKAEEGAGDARDSPSLPDLIEAAGANQALKDGPRWEDSDKPWNGLLDHAYDEALKYVSRLRVDPDRLEERTVEMAHTAAYVAAGAAFHGDYIPTFDFFLIHHLTSTPMFFTINKFSWIPKKHKVRFLEWKMRLDVIEYIVRGSPQLDRSRIAAYQPKDKDFSHNPQDLLPKFHNDSGRDDSHTIKVVRALMIVQEASKSWPDRDWRRIRPGDWSRIHYMLLDNLDSPDSRWVRSAGFEQAWEGRAKAR